MASIVQRKNSISIVYYDPQVVDPKTGKPKQVWVQTTPEKAQEDKRKIELQMLQGTLLVHSSQTVEEFFTEWIAVYAPRNWSVKTYGTNVNLLKKHVYPVIGSLPLQKISSKALDVLFASLERKHVTPPKGSNCKPEDMPFLSQKTLLLIYQVVNTGLNAAVDWELLHQNPLKCKKPVPEKSNEVIWTQEELHNALLDMERMGDDVAQMSYIKQLAIIAYISFYSLLRIGEALGLTWDSIKWDSHGIVIDKTLERVYRDALKIISPREIYHVFPSARDNSSTVLVLKSTKTTYSTRTNDLYPFLEKLLRKRYSEVRNNRFILGKDYHDHNLVFCQMNGDPIEPKLCETWFSRWKKRTELELPDIVYHRLRHSGVSYLMAVSNYNEKLVAAIAGHSTKELEKKQITYHYTHVYKDDRERLAAKVIQDERYYSRKARGLSNEISYEEIKTQLIELAKTADNEKKIKEMMQENAQLANILRDLARIAPAAEDA